MSLFIHRLFKTATIVLCLMIASCGWHLRGQGNVPTVDNVAINGSGAIYQETLRLLQEKNALASSSPRATLVLGQEQWDRRTVSVAGNALAAEYQLTLSLPYSIRDSADNTISQDKLVLVRSYRYDQNDVAGKDREERLLKEEVYREAARQLMRVLAYTING